MEANERNRGEVLARAYPSTSMAGEALSRQTPEVRAVCGNSACTDLCGGRSAMIVPTANVVPSAPSMCRLPY